MESTTNPAPEWVYKRDGRLVPFEADKISRALFVAGESLGKPDAFMARELTDGVLHFLSAEAGGAILTTAQVGELVIKVIRELGQPTLAQAFAEYSQRHADREERARIEKHRAQMEVPDLSLIASRSASFDPVALVRRAGGACLKAYALREVFSRDLAAAHNDGLLALGGLEAPFELSGWLLGAPAGQQLLDALEQARTISGQYIAIDGPEYVVNRAARQSPEGAADYVRELALGLRTTGLQAIVNLNGRSPPFWAGDLADGPLFADQRPASSRAALGAITDDLLERLLDLPDVRVDWHLDEADLADESGDRLRRVSKRALDGGALTFSFDRPRRPVSLAEGIDRQHPAVLMSVGLNLAQLQRQLGNRQSANPAELFLEKLGSLTRLALSAGVQKRAFLRRHDRKWPPFLLERARLVVVPLGLDTVVSQLGSRELTGKIIERLRGILVQDGRACHLDCCIDSTPERDEASLGVRLGGEKQQLRSAAQSPGMGAAGTVTVSLPDGFDVDELMDLLRWLWRQSDVARVRIRQAGQPQTQYLAPWAEPPRAC